MKATTPLFSVVTPVYRPDIGYLREAIESVLAQSLDDWELILVDDGSQQPEVSTALARFADADPRIVTIQRDSNGGIVAAMNDGIRRANGRYLAILDHDDLLLPQALASMAGSIAAHPDAALVYSDFAQLRPDGRTTPFLKPDWSPERLRGNMYLAHLTVWDLDLVRELGGMRPGFDGSQDHDLALRVAETGRPVVHVPEVLYLWRQIPSSTSLDGAVKPYAQTAGVRAVQEHCERTGRAARVAQSPWPGFYELEREAPPGTLISIIVPTRGSVGRVRGRTQTHVVEMARSIRTTTTSCDYEVVLVVDGPGDDDYVAEVVGILGDRVRVVPFEEPFHFARKINLGVAHSSGDLLVMLNDDVEIISPRWLDTLASVALEPDVGAVGALLLFEDDTIQHAGHKIVDGDITHGLLGRPVSLVADWGETVIDHEVSGVTAALLAQRRSVWSEVGGMSELFPGNFNDVDYCLKIRSVGYRIVLCPGVRAYHYESQTRDPEVKDWEAHRLYDRWEHELQEDPFLRSP